jgi:hypothetical protein
VYAVLGCLLERRRRKTERMLWSNDSILNAMQCNGMGGGKADVMTLLMKKVCRRKASLTGTKANKYPVLFIQERKEPSRAVEAPSYLARRNSKPQPFNIARATQDKQIFKNPRILHS